LKRQAFNEASDIPMTNDPSYCSAIAPCPAALSVAAVRDGVDKRYDSHITNVASARQKNKGGFAMKVDPVLNWAEWQFDRRAGPITFRVIGNAETAVAIKFFFYGNGSDATEEAIRDEYEPYVINPEDLNSSKRLGFIFIARPVLPQGKDLYAWIEARQSGIQDKQQAYRYTLESSENFFKMSDGVTVAI
jgi:hypothetical protein